MNYDFSLNFSRQVKELHYLFGFLSYSLDETTYEENIYKAEGFPSDRMNSIFFARQLQRIQNHRVRNRQLVILV